MIKLFILLGLIQIALFGIGQEYKSISINNTPEVDVVISNSIDFIEGEPLLINCEIINNTDV